MPVSGAFCLGGHGVGIGDTLLDTLSANTVDKKEQKQARREKYFSHKQPTLSAHIFEK
jgi:hypothetical protein